MAEQTTAPEVTTAPLIDPVIKSELDQQMAISLNGGVLPADMDMHVETPAADVPAMPTAPVDPFGIFKEKFGYESPEVAIQDIEALRAFRASPPAATLQFENEQSKQIVEALQAGKLDEVYEVLDQHRRIDRLTGAEMTADTAAEVVKLGMQLKYKDLTPAEINYKFNKQFGMPAKPNLMPADDQDEYNERLAAWQAQVDDKNMELMIEAKLARPDLLATKSKLVFPTINRPDDSGFQEWQKLVQENERLASETTAAYKALTPKSIETRFNFKDEPNKIDFQFVHEPDPESFNKTIEMTSDINHFWQYFINSDGTPDRVAFAKALYNGINLEKVIVDAMNQAKNATIKAMLPDNATGGLVRQLPQAQDQTPLDALMKASLKGYAGY